MRKYIRDQLLEIVATVWEGARYAANNSEEAEAVLTDCRSAVYAISEVLDSSISAARAGQYHKCLEDLNTKLTLLAAAVTNVQTVSADIEALKAQIELLEKMLLHESEISYEIVFMPYNANMWDCLESIWLAARDDPQCEVYVVPIPYCGRNPDGKADVIHYDGDRFPGYVSVTHYDAYDLDARRPDVIYIHNPYDAYNYVTSIHPRFYSGELRKYTDMLVYVPYFVSGETVDDSLCAVSAVRYVDRIIVQSEAVQKAFTKYIDKSKVAVLGSPKVDKVIHTLRENQELPEAWEDIVGGRKIVLYNTHLKNIIMQDSGLADKLRAVFAVFAEREDVVIWWRPHPLSEDTIHSMNPLLMQDYNAIVEKFKADRLGVYDDSNDLHRAISLADAYYGDINSSLVYLFYAAGKPVFIQNVGLIGMPKGKYELTSAIRDFVVTDQMMWFIPLYVNALFRMDMTDNTVTFEGWIPDAAAFDLNDYTAITVCGDTLILTPGKGRNIIKYNMKSKQFEQVPYLYTKHNKFLSAYTHKGSVYMMPCWHFATVSYDMENNKLTEDGRLCSNLLKYRAENDIYFGKGGIVQDGWLILAGVGNVIVKYHLDSCRFTCCSVGNQTNRYMCIAYDGNCYWLFPGKGNIVKWNEQTGTAEELDAYPEGFQIGAGLGFMHAAVYGKYIFVFPYSANMVLKIDTDTNLIEPFIVFDEGKQYGMQLMKYLSVKIIDDTIYAASAYDNVLQKINPEDGKIETIPLMLSTEDYNAVMRGTLLSLSAGNSSNPGRVDENPIVTLEFFLDQLSAETVDSGEALTYADRLFANRDGSCGKKTHEYIKNLL